MILDTNALSAFADANEALLAVLDGTPELYLPVIVLGEYRYGISSSRYHAKYAQWLARDLHLSMFWRFPNPPASITRAFGPA